MSVSDNFSTADKSGIKITHVVTPRGLNKLRRVTEFFNGYLQWEEQCQQELDFLYDEYIPVKRSQYGYTDFSLEPGSGSGIFTVKIPGGLELSDDELDGNPTLKEYFGEILPNIASMSMRSEEYGDGLDGFLYTTVTVKNVCMSMESIEKSRDTVDRFFPGNMRFGVEPEKRDFLETGKRMEMNEFTKGLMGLAEELIRGAGPSIIECVARDSEYVLREDKRELYTEISRLINEFFILSCPEGGTVDGIFSEEERCHSPNAFIKVKAPVFNCGERALEILREIIPKCVNFSLGFRPGGTTDLDLVIKDIYREK